MELKGINLKWERNIPIQMILKLLKDISQVQGDYLVEFEDSSYAKM
jgi:hypothetical protein